MTDRIATLRPMPRLMASVLSKLLAMAASLTAASAVPVAPLQAFDKASYNPAILSLSFNQEASADSFESASDPGDADAAFLDLSLITADAPPQGARVQVSKTFLRDQLREFYRYLDQGLPKAEALQATRRAMQTGLIRLQDDQILGVDGTPLISELTELQQSRIAYGMRHPFFWSGIELIGTPW